MSAIPDVTGNSLPTAVSVLTTAGFTVGSVTIQNGGTVDTVFSQNPIAGTIESAGSAVDLVVSIGTVSAINKITQKLLSYFHKVFDKNPYPQLAFRVNFSNADLTWSISNGILTLTPSVSTPTGNLLDETGGTILTESGSSISTENVASPSYSFSIQNFTIGQLADFIAALPGYSVPYQDTSSFSLLSALALLDASGDTDTSNGDHVYGYTNLLWAWIESTGAKLGEANQQIANAIDQMSTTSAQDEWLDYLGGYYFVPRNQDELDANYSPRIIASVLQPRGNNIAIASAIQTIAFGLQNASLSNAGNLLDETGGAILTEGGVSLSLESSSGPKVLVIDAVDDTSFAITYDGLISHDGSHLYDAGLGVDGAWGFFDVDFSFDFSGPVSQSTYFSLILQTVESFRDAGTQLRFVIFRNNGSNTTIVSDTFIGRIRVIVYDDFTGADFRVLEDGSIRLTEAGDARILES